jgi:hypothetical protein
MIHFNYGSELVIKDGTHKFCDDKLSDIKINLISGLYSVSMGMFYIFHHNHFLNDFAGCSLQESKMSWWPLHSTWMSASAGWNTGYWTLDNEVWFQKRLDDICTGKAKP